uniref:Josephin-2 n=1 Tax=Hirondellea gigas TaxID=1518452 RepID=A0A6A7FNZ1_9CRUS
MAPMESIYHEKQVKELCALHSLNNLFQDPTAFTKSDLDSICERLSPDHWLNPHKSMLGTGNYDINVIMAALEVKGCGVVWFDKRKDPATIAVDLVLGFILNIPSEYRVGPVQLPLRRKHWVAVRKVRGAYYNLDSKLDAPVCLGLECDLLEWLRGELCCKDKALFIVASQEVEKTRSWSLDKGSGESTTGAAAADLATTTAVTVSEELQHCNGGLVVNLPPTSIHLNADRTLDKREQQKSPGGRLQCDPLRNTTNVDGQLDPGLQKKLLASVEGEDAFSSPGLKYIDQDALSVGNSLDGDRDSVKSAIKDARNGLINKKSKHDSEVKNIR